MQTKILILFFGVFGLSISLFSQEEKVNLNTLTAPSSPAATLLGISPSQIDKPRDPSEFMASVVSASGGISRLPENYAVEMAPAWMFGGNKITFSDFKSNALPHNLWQSLTISAAVGGKGQSADNPENPTQVAFGLKTSFLRGHRFNQEAETKVASAQNALNRLNTRLLDSLRSDMQYQRLIERSLDNPADTLERNAYQKRKYQKFRSQDGQEVQELQEIQEALQDLRFTRIGFKLDLTAGVVQDFPSGKFDSVSVSKLGVWLTAGYEGEKGLSILGIARILQQADAQFTAADGKIQQGNVQNFDAGARLNFAPLKGKYSLSAEALFRGSNRAKDIPNTHRLALNMEYKLAQNISLNFSYGRDFDGTITRDGNVIALLSLFTSFGNAKRID